jgi:hypothetical protein
MDDCGASHSAQCIVSSCSLIVSIMPSQHLTYTSKINNNQSLQQKKKLENSGRYYLRIYMMLKSSIKL